MVEAASPSADTSSEKSTQSTSTEQQVSNEEETICYECIVIILIFTSLTSFILGRHVRAKTNTLLLLDRIPDWWISAVREHSQRAERQWRQWEQEKLEQEEYGGFIMALKRALGLLRPGEGFTDDYEQKKGGESGTKDIALESEELKILKDRFKELEKKLEVQDAFVET